MSIGASSLSIQLTRVPVLLLVFNRLETTKQVVKRIREVKPPKVYIASDGPRKRIEGESEVVQAVRKYVIDQIDWECEVKTLFRDENLGCGKSVYQSVSWFFDNEKWGVILEDDCVPSLTFFAFCEELLVRFAEDERVGMISGTNHLGELFSESYCFSKFKACWGWASWARAWKNMELDMKWRGTSQAIDILKNMGYDADSCKYWKNSLGLIDTKAVDTWDWQWYYSLAANNQLTIFPKVNLVANVGFGDEATHTKGRAPSNYLKVEEILFPLEHPNYICPNYKYDKQFERVKIKNNSFKRFAPRWLKNLLRPIVKNWRRRAWKY